MTDVTPAPTPAGWYPDPHVPGGQRWWDGGQWTEHAQVPYSAAAAAAALKAPEGTDSNTVWIWLFALLPLLGIFSLFTIDITGYMREVMQGAVSGSGSGSGMLSLYTSPAYLLSIVGSWLLLGLEILFAALDWRALKARGVPQPFHWAFAFFALMGFGIVYAIGRGIVAKRRTGTGTAPMVTAIVVYVVLLIAGGIYTVVIMQQMFALMPSYLPTP